ncbi:MAG TPA: hypothetical protein VNW49_03295 [Puia sp.]|nr:hypothetical protein [Puia sp.]
MLSSYNNQKKGNWTYRLKYNESAVLLYLYRVSILNQAATLFDTGWEAGKIKEKDTG